MWQGRMEGAKGPYVEWEEVVVLNDMGRRVVHYYLKDAGGGADLVVVGRERSLRHMSYVVPSQFARVLVNRPYLGLPFSSRSPLTAGFRWRSRREVIDWLSSLVRDTAYRSSSTVYRFGDGEDAETANLTTPEDRLLGKTGHLSKNFLWSSSFWNCPKKRKHFSSFCKNGVTISVHDFVFIMAEENKRLIAYVEDLYEDPKANKMVVVRWFHKVDEVGFPLPLDTSDREIFYSSCRQDLSVECIDGLATVLSPHHFEQFQNEARFTELRPYFCRRLIDNDIRPFDITQLQGYRSLEVIRSIFVLPLKLRSKISPDNVILHEVKSNVSLTGSKRKRMLHGVETTAADSVKSNKTRKTVTSNISVSPLKREELFMKKLWHQFSPGCHVEVLSQDSGTRGCWFRCVIIKRHQEKAKIRYLDIQDPDESSNLEEWILPSRIAAPDNLGIRLPGRPMVRPFPLQRGKKCNLDVGTIVDAWWHDGWWEGIVMRREPEGQIHVYFPGEKSTSVFSQSDLRQSQDWICNKWNGLESRMDIANSFLPNGTEDDVNDSSVQKHFGYQIPSIREHLRQEPYEAASPSNMDPAENTPGKDSWNDGNGDIPDLIKDIQLLKLRWSSAKRSRLRSELSRDISAPKERCCQAPKDYNPCEGFVLPKALKVDHDNCKIGGDTLFNSPMPLSSLVMSQ